MVDPHAVASMIFFGSCLIASASAARPQDPPRRRHADRPARQPASRRRRRGRRRGRRRPHAAGEVRLLQPRRRRRGRPTASSAPSATARRPSPPRMDGKQATAKVKVVGTKEPFDLELPQPRHPDADAGRLQLRRLPRRAGRQGRPEAVAARLRSRGRPFRPDPAGARPARRSACEPAQQPLPAQADPGRAARRRPEARGRLARVSASSPTGSPPARRARRPTTPRIQRLEVLPAAAVLKPKDTLQVLVRAWYSDGHAEDVTRWAKFNSSEDLVAARRRRRQGRRSPATARRPSPSGTPTSSPPAASPRRCPTPSIPRSSPQAPRNNFIDDLVLKKLESLHIPPSPPCTDAEFIRRAYLDAAGILPTPEEVQKFLADPAAGQAGEADRRPAGAAGVRRLLGVQVVRPAAHLDAAGCRSRRCGRSTSSSARAWPTTSRGTASPATSSPPAAARCDNGAANYFVLHKDVSDLTEATVGHVPGHVDHLLPLPQPSAGEVDAGPVLGDGQPVRARRPEERRPARRGDRAVAARRRRAAPAPRRRHAADAARRQAAAARTARSTAGNTSPTG